MSLARAYDKILKKQLAIRAAWVPVTDPYKVGDYGVISGGVFHKLGDISEFGVTCDKEPGDEIAFDFTSERVKKIKFEAGAQVPDFSDSEAEAKLVLEFERAKAFMIKANMNVEGMANMALVARGLAETGMWRRKYTVISSVYTGTDCVVTSAKSGNTTVEFSGKANALKQLDVGNVSTGLTMDFSHELGLEINGGRGALGLKMFKVRSRGDVKILSTASDLEDDPIDSSDNWPDELEDDI